jgi:hypothetical protein
VISESRLMVMVVPEKDGLFYLALRAGPMRSAVDAPEQNHATQWRRASVAGRQQHLAKDSTTSEVYGGLHQLK